MISGVTNFENLSKRRWVSSLHLIKKTISLQDGVKIDMMPARKFLKRYKNNEHSTIGIHCGHR